MTTDRLTIDELTTRELGFFSDPSLAAIIRDLLDEIDRVFSVRGYRSALYLSISAVEGVLKHALNLNSKKALNAQSFPAGKQIEDLTLFQCIPICSELSLIPPEFENTYDQLRQFRNYIHPERELSSKYNINIGISQLGIGILNLTLLHFNKLRFIEGTTWRVISGDPQYSLVNRQLVLPSHKFPSYPFIVTDYFINSDFILEFAVDVPEGAIMNFVYNYSSEDSYNMIRIDKRKDRNDETKPRDDGLLVCNEKLRWKPKSKFISSPDLTRHRHEITIQVSGSSLKFIVDGSELRPQRYTWDYDLNKSIGFFNELQRVNLEGLKITI